MFVLGHVAVLLLIAAAVLASSSLSRFAKLEPGAEHLLGSMLGASALLLVSIHVLGVTNALWPSALFGVATLLSLTLVWLTREGETFTARARGSAGALWCSARRLGALARELWAAGPVALLAAGALLSALGWATVLTYVCPSDSWDGVWYHDLMVGYAIQEHGYAPIGLPDVSIGPLFQQANGYPRNSEMLSLLFAIYTGRTWLELPSVLGALTLALGTYAFVRRVAPDSRAAPFVWAAAIVLLPGVRLVMRSTYVDNAFAAFNLAAFYFASDPKLDRRRAVIAALAFGLALGTKGMALLSVPPLAVLATTLLLARGGRRELTRNLAALCGALVLVVAVGGVSYILSALRYKNPFWPVTVDLGSLHFAGTVSASTVLVGAKSDVVANLFAVPVPGHDYVDTRITGYGIATGVLLVPLAALGALVALGRAAVALGARWRERRPLTSAELGALTLVAAGAIGALTLWKSPALWGARYNLHGVALLMVFACVPRGEWSRFGAGAVVVVTNLLMWLWSEPGWGVKWGDALARLGRSAAAREADSPLFVKATLRARDSELRRGDLVIWSGNLDFASALHNNSYSNRLKYVGERPLDRAEAEGARWLAVPAVSADAAAARARADRWQTVGMLHAHPQTPTLVFRRVSSAQ
jgi:hypothetical protein